MQQDPSAGVSARTIVKRVALVATFVALLLIACYVLLAVRFWTGKPTITRNPYQELLAAHVTPVPESQRAWPRYRDALLQFPVYPIIEGRRDLGNRWPDVRPTDPEYAVVSAYVRELAPQLAMMREAAALPSMGFVGSAGEDVELTRNSFRLIGQESRHLGLPEPTPENPAAFDILLPHLGQMRQFGRFFAFDTREALRENDALRAVANLRAMLGMSRQLAREPNIISQMVACALHALSVSTLAEALRDHADAFSDAHLALLSREISTSPSPGRVLLNFEGERLSVTDAAQRIYTDDGNGDGRLTPDGVELFRTISGDPPSSTLLANSLMPVTAPFVASRREVLSEFDAMVTLSEQRGALQPWERIASPNLPRVESRLNVLGSTPMGRWRYQVLAALTPAFDRAIWSADVVTASRDAHLCIIAMHRFRLAHNRWPASLDELVPAFLAELPRDLYSGEPLRYLQPAGEGEPTLYSVGSNLRDDGGAYDPLEVGRVANRSPDAPASDWVFWPVPEKPRE